MQNLQSLLQTGLTRHQAGDFPAARAFYEAVLTAEPDNIDGNFLLGTLLFQTKDYPRAEELLKKTLRLRPNTVSALVNLGRVYHDQSSIDQALDCYRAACRLDPAQIDALNNLAVLEIERKNYAAADSALKQARAASPAHVATLLNSALLAFNLGDIDIAVHGFQAVLARDSTNLVAGKHLVKIFCSRGRFDEALVRLNHMMSIKPGDAELIWLRGVLKERRGQMDAAMIDYESAFRLKPDLAEACVSLGLMRYRVGQKKEAVRLLEQATLAHPNFYEAWVNLCNVLTESGRFDEAIAAGRKAVELNPNCADGYINLGVALYSTAHFESAREVIQAALDKWPSDERALAALAAIYQRSCHPRALELYDKLLQTKPDDAGLHWNRALIHLRQGNLPQGWEDYEWGVHTKERHGPSLPVPYWQGEPLENKTIMIVREQGVGDELMFASCIPDIARVAGKTIVGCEPRFVALFKRSFPACEVVGIDKTISGSELANKYRPDFYVRIGSLPRHFRCDLASFPDRESYLIPDPVRVEHWHSWLSTLEPGIKVAICWRSRLRNALRDSGFTELDEWTHLFRVPGVVWVNAQYGECEEELKRAESLFGVTIYRPPGLDQMHALDDVAALMAAVDVVVTAGTSVHVMAGAVGTATLLLGRAPIMSLGTATEPWFKRVEQIAEYEKAVTLRMAAYCVERIVASCTDKATVNKFFSQRLRDLLDVSPRRPLIFTLHERDDMESLVWRKYGEFASAEEECFSRYVSEGAFAIEVGASIGIQTLKLIKHIGATGWIRVVEADATRFQQLRENLIVNRVKNAELYCHAVGDEGKSVPQPRQAWELEETSFDRGEVAAVPLEQIAYRTANFVRVAGIGRHLSVLRSARRLLLEDRAVFYLVDVDPEQAELRALLEEAGYVYWFHKVPWVSESAHRGKSKDEFAGRTELNFICVPREHPYAAPSF